MKTIIENVVKSNLDKIKYYNVEYEQVAKFIDITNMDLSEIKSQIKNSAIPNNARVIIEGWESDRICLYWDQYDKLSKERFEQNKLQTFCNRTHNSISETLKNLGYRSNVKYKKSPPKIESYDVNIDELHKYYSKIYNEHI